MHFKGELHNRNPQIMLSELGSKMLSSGIGPGVCEAWESVRVVDMACYAVELLVLSVVLHCDCAPPPCFILPTRHFRVAKKMDVRRNELLNRVITRMANTTHIAPVSASICEAEMGLSIA